MATLQDSQCRERVTKGGPTILRRRQVTLRVLLVPLRRDFVNQGAVGKRASLPAKSGRVVAGRVKGSSRVRP